VALTIAPSHIANRLPRAKYLIAKEIGIGERRWASDSGQLPPGFAQHRRAIGDGLRIARVGFVRWALGIAMLLGAAGLVVFDWHRRAGESSSALGRRNDALTRAQVTRAAPPRESSELDRNPPDVSSLGSDDLVECRYQPFEANGTTPKFACILASGEVVKVKYGRNPEIAAEVAATRLLEALRFGADRMYLIRRVRCYGCPSDPYRIQQAADLVRGQKLLTRAIDFSTWSEFDWAAIERKEDLPDIAAPGTEGWAWWELERVDARYGGASRAEIDALRLTAMFLAHWDNKSENQRLVCLSGEPAGQSCRKPFAHIQDLGATFGPRKADLAGWRSTHVWSDSATCATSMKALPHSGATYDDVSISEAGRRLLATRLSRLDEGDVRKLVVGSRLAAFDGSEATEDEVKGWIDAFMAKIREISDRAPCPRVAS
jgi:hypothetical protein